MLRRRGCLGSVEAGVPVVEVAKMLGKSVVGCNDKISRLGLEDPK